MKKKHLNNLSKLADFLENEVTNKQFNIKNYLTHEGESVYVNQEVPECGTVGCAIGWATCLFYKEALKEYTYSGFSKSVFGLNPFGTRWSFLFGADQTRKESTRRSTIKRIRNFVKQKGVLTRKQIIQAQKVLDSD